MNKESSKKYQQLLLNFDAYAKKQKIMAKASFYKDDSRDDRFIQWEDFLKIWWQNELYKS